VLYANTAQTIRIGYEKITNGKGIDVSLLIGGVALWTKTYDDYLTSVSWPVDNVESAACKIEVRDQSSDAADASDRNFVIHQTPPTIDLTYPDGGETLSVNEPIQIQWTSTKANLVPQVEIRIGMRQPGHEIEWDEQPIATVANQEGANTYTWSPPEARQDVMMRIQDPRDGAPSDMTRVPFNVILVPTVITVDVPNGPEHNMVVGTKRYIKWAHTGPNQPANVVIKLTRTGNMGDAQKIHSAATVPNNGTFEWIVTGPPADRCLIWIGDADGLPCDTSDREFRILTDIAVAKPKAGEYEMGTMMEIPWTPKNWPANVKVDLNRNGSWKSLTAPETSIPNQGKMTWKVTGPKAESYHVLLQEDCAPLESSSSRRSTSASRLDFCPWPL